MPPPVTTAPFTIDDAMKLTGDKHAWETAPESEISRFKEMVGIIDGKLKWVKPQTVAVDTSMLDYSPFNLSSGSLLSVLSDLYRKKIMCIFRPGHRVVHYNSMKKNEGGLPCEHMFTDSTAFTHTSFLINQCSSIEIYITLSCPKRQSTVTTNGVDDFR